ncbi:MAG: hypothetical protein V4515_12575 [Chloroflexota bacterium]
MTDQPTHGCVVCPQLRQGDPRIYDRANVCEGCRARLRSMLIETVEHYVRLDPRKGSTGGERVSGSRTAPLPLLVDPLDLRMPPQLGEVSDTRMPQYELVEESVTVWLPARPDEEYRSEEQTLRRRRATGELGPSGDQVGELSVATMLESWARDWQTYWWALLPAPTVVHLARWLGVRLEKACDEHPAIDDFAADLRDNIRALRRVNGELGPLFDLLDVPCRRCDWLSLVPMARADRVECLHCGDLASGEEYQRWIGLLAAGVRDQWVDFDLDKQLYVDEAALLVKVTQNTIRLWIKRGVLSVADRDHGRPRLLVRDVFEAERRTRSGLLAV